MRFVERRQERETSGLEPAIGIALSHAKHLSNFLWRDWTHPAKTFGYGRRIE